MMLMVITMTLLCWVNFVCMNLRFWVAYPRTFLRYIWG
jgi:hypothetical protein